MFHIQIPSTYQLNQTNQFYSKKMILGKILAILLILIGVEGQNQVTIPPGILSQISINQLPELIRAVVDNDLRSSFGNLLYPTAQPLRITFTPNPFILSRPISQPSTPQTQNRWIQTPPTPKAPAASTPKPEPIKTSSQVKVQTLSPTLMPSDPNLKPRRLVNCWSNPVSETSTSATCAKCDPYHYKYNDTVCLPFEPFCRVYKNDTVCEKCEPGFIIGQKGFCVVNFLNCTSADFTEIKCKSCNQGLSFANGGCAPINETCEVLNPAIPFGCLRCAAGLILKADGSCFTQTRTGCEVMAGNGDCIKCYVSENQTLINGQCFKSDQIRAKHYLN